jgi:hypothetical protein
MRVEDLKHIAKVFKFTFISFLCFQIPSLPHNIRVEFNELVDSSKYPSSLSLFPDHCARLVSSYPYINTIEMPDVTRIPKRLSSTYGPTITVELKPKQGFFQQHPGVDVQYCNNCVLQIEKCNSGAFEQ